MISTPELTWVASGSNHPCLTHHRSVFSAKKDESFHFFRILVVKRSFSLDLETKHSILPAPLFWFRTWCLFCCCFFFGFPRSFRWNLPPRLDLRIGGYYWRTHAAIDRSASGRSRLGWMICRWLRFFFWGVFCLPGARLRVEVRSVFFFKPWEETFATPIP